MRARARTIEGVRAMEIRAVVNHTVRLGISQISAAIIDLHVYQDLPSLVQRTYCLGDHTT